MNQCNQRENKEVNKVNKEVRHQRDVEDTAVKRHTSVLAIARCAILRGLKPNCSRYIVYNLVQRLMSKKLNSNVNFSFLLYEFPLYARL